MENVAHALAGALLAAAACRLMERKGGALPVTVRRAAFTIGVITAELPDLDLVYSGASLGMGKLGYLLHHRGHTHTVLFALVGALAIWAIAMRLGRMLRAPEYARPLLWLSIVGTMSHVALDYTNSYGVHPFWPLDTRWFYGDAVFIVEPWLWVVALPPLFLIARGTAWRVLCAVLLAIILVASWRVTLVERDVATALTIGAIVWFAVIRLVPPARRSTTALLAWLVLEGMFFASAAVARRTVQRAVGASLRDVVLAPAPGNPLCLSAIVVTEADGIYGASVATVAPIPSVRNASSCPFNDRGMPRDASLGPANSPAIRWGGSWSAPIAELRAIAASDCWASAALRFIRVPIWRRGANGGVSLFDLRFGDGTGSFASVETSSAAQCPHPVPNWEWPRSDMLGAAP